MTLPPQPVRIAIVNDYEIVVVGVAAMLAPYRDRVVVVEIDARLPVWSDVDLVLVDTFGQVAGDGVDLIDLVGLNEPKVVVFSWSASSESVAAALSQGALGYLSKSLTAEELVDALEAVHHGEAATSADVEHGNARGHGDWPGRPAGLTPREAEMLSFIAKGLTNQEIAAAAYLSVNSVKTYIRLAYRKIGVSRRSQAVMWALANGFGPESKRSVNLVREDGRPGGAGRRKPRGRDEDPPVAPGPARGTTG